MQTPNGINQELIPGDIICVDGQPFKAKVVRVDSANNDLYVEITSTTSGTWNETWNLSHTYVAFQQHYYYLDEQSASYHSLRT